jgi:DNA-3-methyladenine glycosylase
MKKVLTPSFFDRSALEVAPDLLGKYLIKIIDGEESAFKITEVEAYEGLEDLASHASKGRTKRTEVMFGEAGIFYIYLIYGMYYMLNVVTGKKDHPAAVLIRGVEGVAGPGKLTKTMGIDKSFNNLEIGKKAGMWFEDRGEKIDSKNTIKSARIGVDYAGPIWAKKDYRFYLKENSKQSKTP